MALFRHREERREEAVRYKMQEKIFSIGGDYWIENDRGERAGGRVRGERLVRHHRHCWDPCCLGHPGLEHADVARRPFGSRKGTEHRKIPVHRASAVNQRVDGDGDRPAG